MKVNLSRVAKLEIEVKEHRRQKKKRPTIDYSAMSDEELNSLFEDKMVKLMSEPSIYAGMTDHQLSDLYMRSIQEGNARNSKKVK